MLSIELTDIEKSILQGVVAEAPRSGYSIEQVRTALDILKKMRETNSQTILVEKAEHRFLVERLDNTQWVKADADILSLDEKVRNAQEVKVQAVPAAA